MPSPRAYGAYAHDRKLKDLNHLMDHPERYRAVVTHTKISTTTQPTMTATDAARAYVKDHPGHEMVHGFVEAGPHVVPHTWVRDPLSGAHIEVYDADLGKTRFGRAYSLDEDMSYTGTASWIYDRMVAAAPRKTVRAARPVTPRPADSVYHILCDE